MRTSVEDGFLLPLPRCSQLGNVSHKYATNPTNSNAKSRILQMPTSHHNTTTTGIADNSNSHQSCQKRVLCSDKDTNCKTHIPQLFHTSSITMSNYLSISSSMMLWPCRIFFLLSILSAFDRSSVVVNGFETPSRYTLPKGIHESILRNKEQQSLKPSPPSVRKYDLGLGKNKPLLPNNNPKGQGTAKMSASYSAESGHSNDNTKSATYDACQFLVEHEATRAYPAPEEKRTDTQSSNDRLIDTATTKTTLSREGPSSNGKKDSKAQTKEQQQGPYWGSKAISTKASSSSAHSAPNSNSPRKKKQPVKVQPKRLLEDCLIILDHDDSSDAPAPVSMNSTIWSHPDTPQLDMNSVWVEMLLHNQMGLAQQQHQK